MADADSIDIVLTDEGRSLSQFVKSYTLESDYTVATDGWTVDLFSPNPGDLLNLELQPIEILINGASQVVGRVEVTDAGGDGTSITIAGRDYIADLVECHIDPSFKTNPGETLDSVLLRACGPAGINGVVDDADVGMRDIRSRFGTQGRQPPVGMAKKSADELKAEPGMGLFDWCNRAAARIGGATIQPGIGRNQLVLSKPFYEQTPRYGITRRRLNARANSNNVIETRATQDLSSFPTHVVAVGKVGKTGRTKQTTGVSTDAAWLGSDAVADRIYRGRHKPDQGPRPGTELYRLRYLRDEDCRTELELSNLAARHLSEHLRHSLDYRVTLKGFTDPGTGAIWAVDTMLSVDDEVRGIREPLWVAARTFRYAAGNGATTDLRCWRPWSYVI